MEEINRDRRKIERIMEMGTEEISKMIDEGGIGADKYYQINRLSEKPNEENLEDGRNS